MDVCAAVLKTTHVSIQFALFATTHAYTTWHATPRDRARATYKRALAFYHLLYQNGSLATLIPKHGVDNVDVAETLTSALGESI